MKVGVLGTGVVGQVLASGFAAEGHQTMLGSRNPGQEKVQAWLKTAGPKACASTDAEAAAFKLLR